MSNQDSFINEVSEEVRKDKLYALMKRYGWIAVAVVLLVVGGASVFEWQKSKARAQAEATGDALISALSKETPEERAAAINAFEAAGSADQRAIVGLLKAAADAEAGDGGVERGQRAHRRARNVLDHGNQAFDPAEQAQHQAQDRGADQRHADDGRGRAG